MEKAYRPAVDGSAKSAVKKLINFFQGEGIKVNTNNPTGAPQCRKTVGLTGITTDRNNNLGGRDFTQMLEKNQRQRVEQMRIVDDKHQTTDRGECLQ